MNFVVPVMVHKTELPLLVHRLSDMSASKIGATVIFIIP